MTEPNAELATVADVLAEHQYGGVLGDYEVAPYFRWIKCNGCDWTQDIAGMSGWPSWVRAHAEHVAEEVERVIAERLEGNDRMHRVLGQAKDRQLLSLEQRLEAVRLVTYASDDGTEYEHNRHAPHDGEPECPGCWVATIRAALGVHTPPAKEAHRG